MNPDRRAGIGLHRNPDRNPVARLALATFIAAGSFTSLPPLLEKLASSWFQITPAAEAFDPKCQVGLGLQVEPKFYANGARFSVIESGTARHQEPLDPARERLIDLGVAPSNTTRDGKDARVVVHFAADQRGKQLTPMRKVEVNCGKLEHVKYISNGEATSVTSPVTRTATLTPLPSVTPTPDRVATLEAKLQGIIAQSTRTAEDEKLARTAQATGEANTRATVIAEAQATATVRSLIQEAEKRGRESYIATATAVVSSTAGAAGTRAGSGFEIPSIPSVPWIPLAGGLGMLVLVGAELKSQRVRHTTGNVIKFTPRAFKRFILKQPGVNVWP